MRGYEECLFLDHPEWMGLPTSSWLRHCKALELRDADKNRLLGKGAALRCRFGAERSIGADAGGVGGVGGFWFHLESVEVDVSITGFV